MTGYTVHSGSNDKFSSGWDRVFKAKKTASSAKPPKAKAKPGKKK